MFFLMQKRPVALGISLSYFWLVEQTRQLYKQLHFGRVCLHTRQTQGSFCSLSGGKSKGDRFLTSAGVRRTSCLKELGLRCYFTPQEFNFPMRGWVPASLYGAADGLMAHPKNAHTGFPRNLRWVTFQRERDFAATR